MTLSPSQIRGAFSSTEWIGLVALFFIVFQVFSISNRERVPRPEELHRIQGKLLKADVIRRKGTYDAEITIQSPQGDVILYIPDASSIRSAISALPENSAILADFAHSITARRPMLRAWNLTADERSLIAYHDMVNKEHDSLNFSRFLVAASTLVFMAAFFIAVRRRRI